MTRDERVGLIAFASERSGNSEIHVMNADGSALAQRTDNPRLRRSVVRAAAGA